MPRKPRFQILGVPQHIVQRGNNRSACFFSESDYHYYLDALQRAASRFGGRVHAYALMTNHVHLLLTPEQEHAPSLIMQSVGGRYVRHINEKYRRSGTLWEGRFKAGLIQSERYLLTCYRYIELNPVRAGMVESPGQYRWSSYRANALGLTDRLVSPHQEYLRLGTTTGARQAAYRALCDDRPDAASLDAIRSATDHELVAGTNRFKDELAQVISRPVRGGRPGRPGKPADRKR